MLLAYHYIFIQYRWTILPPMDLQTNKYGNASPSPWTCVSIGYKTESNNNNFMYIGDLDEPTSRTISQNTTRLHIIVKNVQPTYTVQKY
jgi:hypothetical protein